MHSGFSPPDETGVVGEREVAARGNGDIVQCISPEGTKYPQPNMERSKMLGERFEKHY
jgi:hypothetical protein